MPSFRELLKQTKSQIEEIDPAEAERRLADARPSSTSASSTSSSRG